MGSVDAWHWKLCARCADEDRAEPAGGEGCKCKASAWRARWRDPAGRSRSKVFVRKVDASAHLAHVESARARGTYVDPASGRQRFDDFGDEWAASQDWKASTREAWPYIGNRLSAVLGRMPLAAIDQLELKRARAELSARYSHATVKLTMAYAGMIMRAAYASGRIGRDPTVGLKGPKARAGHRDGTVGPEDVPTRAEALAILAGTPLPFRAGVALGLAGLRIGEVLGMTADRIAIDRREVTVDRQMQVIGNERVLTTPKAEKVRTITVPAVVAVELRRHLRERPEGILFRGLRGAPMLRRDQFYSSAWRPALKAAGMCAPCKAAGLTDPSREDGCECRQLAFRFHACRHWCASTLLAEGAPLAAVAGHLGDTVETVSRIYVHWLRDDREVPASVLDRVLAPVSPPCHDGKAAGE
jgi:integrase